MVLYLAPTLDTTGGQGGRIGVSLGDGPMKMLRAELEATGGVQDTPGKKLWAQAVCDNIMSLTAEVGVLAAGPHTVRIWRLDDNIVLQKLVVRPAATERKFPVDLDPQHAISGDKSSSHQSIH